MSHLFHNPFAGKDIKVPLEFHEAFQRYSQRQENPLISESPFPRMVDFWFLSVCVACRLGLDPPHDIIKHRTVKFADGSIFNSDPWRIHMLMLVAINSSRDVGIVAKPNEMLSIANGLAVAGIPKVIDMLNQGDDDPIWNLTDAIHLLLRQESNN